MLEIFFIYFLKVWKKANFGNFLSHFLHLKSDRWRSFCSRLFSINEKM